MPKFFNRNLKYIRSKKNISQQELADKIGVDRSTISRWENEDMDATVEKALQVANVLNVPFPEFFSEDLTFDNAEIININPDTVMIPVLGVIKADIPIEAQENIIEYIDIPKEWTKGDKQFYGLKVSGDSMYPNYDENDIVIFEKSEDYQKANSKDCAVMVNGYDATFKKVLIQNENIILQPYNNKYDIAIYNKEQIEELPVRIIGIAREKRVRL